MNSVNYSDKLYFSVKPLIFKIIFITQSATSQILFVQNCELPKIRDGLMTDVLWNQTDT